MDTVRLLRQLCDSVGAGAAGAPLRTEKQQEDLLQYALRLLSSNLSPSVARDELHVVDVIKRQLTRDRRSEDAHRFSELHHSLASKGGLRDRWAVLLFLLETSQRTDDTAGPAFPLPFTSVVSGGLPRQSDGVDRPKDGGVEAGGTGDGGVEVDGAPQARPTPKQRAVEEYQRTQVVSVQDSSRTENTMHEVSEAALLRDILFVFQGIDGAHVRFDPVSSAYVVDPMLGVPTTIRDKVAKLGELGWLYAKVNDFVRRRGKHESAGAVERALCIALQTELLEYFRLISVLEAQLGAASTAVPGARPAAVTLRRLMVWVQEPLVRMRMLAVVVDTCKPLHGGAIISALHRLSRHGDVYVQELMHRCLTCSITPIFALLSSWIYDGELVDPYHEFFIAEDLEVDSRELWERKYRVAEEMLPSFFPQDLAVKVLLIGKSINYIRRVCQDRDPLTNTASKMRRTEFGRDLRVEQAMTELRASVDDVYSMVSKRLLELLFGKHKLMGHLRAMRQYLLLGQGDFMLHLMGMLETELDKPGTSLHIHNLTSTLEAAIRATNAQYDDPEILARLDVNLETQSGEVGWSLFSLTYRTDGPISPIFRKEFLIHYRKLFMFLWNAKYMEFALAKMWSLQMSFSRLAPRLPAMASVITKCYAVHAAMLHFVNQIQYYFNFEVLECSWDDLEKELTAAKDLDQVIDAHRSFLKRLTERALLGSDPRSRNLAAQIRSIFDVIKKFRNVQELLYRMATDQLDRIGDATQGPRGTWGLTFEETDRLEVRERRFAQQEVPEAGARVDVLSRQFNQMVGRFLAMLTKDTDQNLRFLSFRIDFNERYKTLSPEYQEACSPTRPVRTARRNPGPSNLGKPAFTPDESVRSTT